MNDESVERNGFDASSSEASDDHSSSMEHVELSEQTGSSMQGPAPMVMYTPPTIWSVARGAAINLILPFINGLMLGFGELFAHEAAFRLGWNGTKIFPSSRSSHSLGPGIEVRDNPAERRRRTFELEDLTSME